MERFSQRESVLLGYNNLPRPLMNMNPFPSSKTSKPYRNSDVDFQDVFGGPPRRFSMQESRPVFGLIDDHDHGDGGGKPVFGDDGGASQRRLPSADFFNDIFGGDAVANSPKRHGRDGGHVFPASPGSRALSPLPPQADPFVSSSPFAQFSLPAKVSKVQEIPTFGGSSSHSSSNSSSSRNSLSKLKDGSPNANPLSRFSNELNRAAEKNFSESRPLFTTEEEESNRVNNSKDSEGLVTSTNVNGHFHFSIYKWAGKSHVPLDIPLRAKNAASSKPKVDVAKSESFVGTDQNVNDDDDNNNDHKTPFVDSFSSGLPLDEIMEEKETPSVVAKDEPEKETAKGICENKEEAPKPEVKSVDSLFYDDFERGLDEKKTMDKNTKGLSSPSVGYTKTTKKQDRKNASEFEKANGGGVTFSPRRESNGKSRVKGKVRDFVKIFNQESSPKIGKEGFMSRSKSCKWNDKCTFEDDERIDSAREEEKLQKPKANEDLKQSAKVHASLHDNSTPSPGSFSDGSKATAEESDEYFHDNFQVKELTQDENGQLESVTQNQEFQEIDAKIRQWTKGKEGNIRSLLSTLQFVLWGESGWKAVPLVDIIEGNSVKRAYQRALLCLHPDKLQQKGASSHQKYLAEKVFDILQEAWNYFNSLGAV